MRLTAFSLGCLVATCLVHLVWIAHNRRRISSLPVHRAAAAFALASMLELLRTLLVVATVSSLFVLVSISLVTRLGGQPSHLLAALGSIQRLRTAIEHVGPWWTGSLAVAALVALLILHREHGRARFANALKAVRDREKNRREAADKREAREELLRQLTQQFDTITANIRSAAEDPAANEEWRRQRMTIEYLREDCRQLNREIGPDSQEQDPDHIAIPDPVTFWGRAKAIFITQGLFDTLGWSRRALYVSAAFLVVPSLVGIEVGAGHLALAQARLEQLLVEASAEQARRDWQEAKQQATSSDGEEWTTLDEQAVYLATRVFEEAFAAPPVAAAGRTEATAEQRRKGMALDITITDRSTDAPEGARGEPSAGSGPSQAAAGDVAVYPSEAEAEMRSAHVRKQVLQQFLPHGVKQAGIVETLSRAPGLSKDEQTILANYEAANVGGTSANAAAAGTSRIGAQFAQELRAEMEKRPRLRASIRSALTRMSRRFGHPTTVKTLHATLVTTILSEVAFGRSELEGALGAVADVVRTIRPEAVRRVYDIRSARFFTATDQDASVEEAARRAADDTDRPAWTTAEGEGLLALKATRDHMRNRIAKFPASLSGADVVAPPGVDQILLHEHMKHRSTDPSQDNRSRRRETWADPIASYEDLFPGRDDSRANTPWSKVIRRDTDGDPPPTGAAPKLPPSNPNAPSGGAGVDFERSRSFAALDTHADVGGVLIGRPPRKREHRSPIDFRDVRWRVGEDGMTLYLDASDGQAHRLGPYPVDLVRRALAYAADGRSTAVTILRAEPLDDRRVYVHPALIDSPIGRAAIDIDRFVYSYADATETRKLIEMGKTHVELLRFGYEIARNGRSAQHGREKYLRALQTANTMRDDARSPLPAISTFYPTQFVDSVRRCATQSLADLTAYENCMSRLSSDHGCSWGNTAAVPGHNPPFAQVVSGVREEEYEPDPRLEFLDSGGRHGDLWPFRFMEQIVLAMDENIITDHAWAPKGREAEIEAAIRNRIRDDPDAARSLDEMREFTIVQRLFRTAFAGAMGPQFPLERLVALATATRGLAGAPSSRTPRWQAMSSGARMTEELVGLRHHLRLDPMPKDSPDYVLP
ncbi:MAG: hypothetical protein JXA57_11495 [Armatimonadetes bacterium]|nr:hypothetical protein [Armatimonadota bacterium]